MAKFDKGIISKEQEVIVKHILYTDWTINTVLMGELVRCKDCRWGREVCGNIECFADRNAPPEYHGYDWFCPNGERRTDE